MKKIIIENDFWDIFPEAKIGVVVCRGINNFIQDDKKYDFKCRERSCELSWKCDF